MEFTQAGAGGAHKRRFQVSLWGNDSWQGSQAPQVAVEDLGVGERILCLFVAAGIDSLGIEGRRGNVYVRLHVTLFLYSYVLVLLYSYKSLVPVCMSLLIAPLRS